MVLYLCNTLYNWKQDKCVHVCQSVCCLGRSCIFVHAIVYLLYGVDLVTYLIKEGFVGGYGGREKIFCFRNANRKILDVYGIHLVCWGQFSYQSLGGSRLNKGDCG